VWNVPNEKVERQQCVVGNLSDDEDEQSRERTKLKLQMADWQIMNTCGGEEN
jgi:hypothetical protein